MPSGAFVMIPTASSGGLTAMVWGPNTVHVTASPALMAISSGAKGARKPCPSSSSSSPSDGGWPAKGLSAGVFFSSSNLGRSWAAVDSIGMVVGI